VYALHSGHVHPSHNWPVQPNHHWHGKHNRAWQGYHSSPIMVVLLPMLLCAPPTSSPLTAFAHAPYVQPHINGMLTHAPTPNAHTRTDYVLQKPLLKLYPPVTVTAWSYLFGAALMALSSL